jgi:hypothetical protein
VLIPYYAPPPPTLASEKLRKQRKNFLSSSVKCPLTTTTIIGADINASIGTRYTDDPQRLDDDNELEFQEETIMELLRPHGNPYRNENGERILKLMREHELRAASTFFESNNTWIDHMFIPRRQLHHTNDVKRKLDSINSDHAALCITFWVSNEALLFKHTERNREPPEATRTKIDNFLL